MDRVRNPLTGKMINIGGPTFNKLYKQGVKFSDGDQEKIVAAGFAAPPKIGSKVKAMLARKVKSLRERNKTDYIDSAHQRACETGDMSHLEEPITKTVVTVTPFYSKTYGLTNGRFLDYLDRGIPFLDRGPGSSILYGHNNYNKAVFERLFGKDGMSLDAAWMRECDDYIRGLNKYDMFTLAGYTNHSHWYINSYMAGTMTEEALQSRLASRTNHTKWYFPFYMQARSIFDEIDLDMDVTVGNRTKRLSYWLSRIEKDSMSDGYMVFIEIMQHLPWAFWVKTMNLFKDDLERIIAGAPPTKKRIVVYRGVKDDYFARPEEVKRGYHTSATFLSTTLSPRYANLFRGEHCCFKRITILPGSRALFMSGASMFKNDFQVLINVGASFYIKNRKKTITTYVFKELDDMNRSEDICFSKLEKIEVSDLVML